MDYEVQIPKVESAVISPNPVYFNSSFTISVSIEEETIALEPYYYYSGDIYSGEVQ